MKEHNFEYEIILAAEPDMIGYFEYDYPLYKNPPEGESEEVENKWVDFMEPFQKKYPTVDMYLVWNYWTETRKRETTNDKRT